MDQTQQRHYFVWKNGWQQSTFLTQQQQQQQQQRVRLDLMQVDDIVLSSRYNRITVYTSCCQTVRKGICWWDRELAVLVLYGCEWKWKPCRCRRRRRRRHHCGCLPSRPNRAGLLVLSIPSTLRSVIPHIELQSRGQATPGLIVICAASD